MNGFYQQPRFQLWLKAGLLGLCGLALGCYITIMAFYYDPLYYLSIFPYIPLMQFAGTPLLTLTGSYTYYSPLLLGYNATEKKIDLHSGTSFDYLFVMKGVKPGPPFKRQLLVYYLEGLRNLIQRIEEKTIPDTVRIVGTSYFFNDRTIQKLGFELEKPTLFYRLNLLINFVDLFWMYSLSQDKISIPRVWNAKKAGISGARLVESKEAIERLYQKLRA